jgi:hypothetical protein
VREAVLRLVSPAGAYLDNRSLYWGAFVSQITVTGLTMTACDEASPWLPGGTVDTNSGMAGVFISGISGPLPADLGSLKWFSTVFASGIVPGLSLF